MKLRGAEMGAVIAIVLLIIIFSPVAADAVKKGKL